MFPGGSMIRTYKACFDTRYANYGFPGSSQQHLATGYENCRSSNIRTLDTKSWFVVFVDATAKFLTGLCTKTIRNGCTKIAVSNFETRWYINPTSYALGHLNRERPRREIASYITSICSWGI